MMAARFAVPCLALALTASLAHASALDDELQAQLDEQGFTGNVQSTLASRLGRPIDAQLADLGQLIFFDTALSLHDDTSCAACHSPTNAWGDTQSISIGVQSNGVVGPRRTGPRNQRRAPAMANTAFYPVLLWDGRVWSESNDPFDNSDGFEIANEGAPLFFPTAPADVAFLLIAQAFVPPTKFAEMAGFTGTAGTLGDEYDDFDDGLGEDVPDPDHGGFYGNPIRAAIEDKFNGIPEYVDLFGEIFPDVAAGDPIDFTLIARAIAEFELTQVYADAPLDQFARGDTTAMTDAEKRGAILFFDDARCVSCHSTAGDSNEMFSDFIIHVIGVPQLAPKFGVGTGNILFDGPDENEDWGVGDPDGSNPANKYHFRTAPLRNAALSVAYMHNGAFTDLEEAIRHHLDAYNSARNYDPVAAGVAADLTELGPVESMLTMLSPKIDSPPSLTDSEISDLVAFVGTGLLDTNANSSELCKYVPTSVPSGAAVEKFPGCKRMRPPR
jgi:cytochrome c peroxidase